MEIVGGTLWLAGPFGTMYALAAEGIAAIGHDSRDVRPDESALAQLVRPGHPAARDKLRITDSIGANDRPFAFPRFDCLNSQKAMTDPLFRYISPNLRTGQGA